MPLGYFIARAHSRDAPRYRPMRRVLSQLAATYGARYLVRTDEIKVLAGTDPGGRLAVIEFPSTQKLRMFMESPEFHELMADLKAAGLTDVIAVPGIRDD